MDNLVKSNYESEKTYAVRDLEGNKIIQNDGDSWW